MIYFQPPDPTTVAVNGPVDTKPKGLKFNIAIDVPDKVWAITMVLASYQTLV